MSLLDVFARLFTRKRAARNVRTCAAPAVLQTPEVPSEPSVELAQAEPDAEYWWERCGETAPAAADLPVAPDPRESQVGAVVQRILEGGDVDLPVLPVVAHRALSQLQGEGVDYHELARLVGEDPAISARVLRVVNSTAYARLFRIDRLEVAFARLGCTTLRGIILASALKGVAIRTGGAQRTLGEELWQRAIVSAVVLNELSGRLKLNDGEVFLVGLLHDIGNFAILRILHDERLGAASVSRGMFDRLSLQWHEILGAYLARSWRLGEPLPEVIGSHHADPAPHDPLARYRWLIQFAEVVCSLLGYSTPAAYDFFALPCTQNLGIVDDSETRRWLVGLPALIIDRTGVF